jgi:ubiquilin
MESMLQNPQMMQQMTAMMSNPAFMDSMIAANPALGNILTPEMRTMMQSPFFQQMLSDPNMVRSMMQMSGGMGGANPLGSFPTQSPAAAAGNANTPSATGTQPNATPGSGLGLDPAMLQQMMQSLGGGGGGFGAPAAPQDTRPPEERFQVQLQQLNEMGFWDAAKNIRALLATGGNVNAAIEYLFSNP